MRALAGTNGAETAMSEDKVEARTLEKTERRAFRIPTDYSIL